MVEEKQPPDLGPKHPQVQSLWIGRHGTEIVKRKKQVLVGTIVSFVGCIMNDEPFELQRPKALKEGKQPF